MKYTEKDLVEFGNQLLSEKREVLHEGSMHGVTDADLENFKDAKIEVELNTQDLRNLIKGCEPSYSVFENELLIKAGYSYSNQSGRGVWNNLNDLTNEELWELYKICK